MSPRLGLPLLVGSVLLSIGCQTRNADKCITGFETTRKAVAAADFALAKQWREHTYRMCDPNGEDKDQLAALDKEIVTAETTIKAAADADADRKAKNGALLKTFTSWVGDNKAAADKASVSHTCDTPTDAVQAAIVEKSKERLCTATRQAGDGITLTARYWEADPKLARFSVKFASPVSCADFGATETKSFDVPATNGSSVKRSRCDITSGALSGMSVVVSAANNAEAYVFSPGILEKDKLMKQIAGG